MQSSLPGNEAARSRVLWNYRILDTPPEERFDDLVRVATYVYGTPIGLVGLIDAGREWLKSRVGWDVSEIPREISFGTHTIMQPDVLIVSDTLKDIRFAKNQLAAQAGARFYAGVPLLTPEGYARSPASSASVGAPRVNWRRKWSASDFLSRTAIWLSRSPSRLMMLYARESVSTPGSLC